MTQTTRIAPLGDLRSASLGTAFVLFAMTALALVARPAVGAWATFGNQAATAAQNQVNAQAISDGSGGMIVVWQDFRTGVADIYAQRFDANGNKLWGDGGVAVSTADNHQETPVLVSNGSGGAVIAWQDLRSGIGYDIYAQAVSSAGALQWPADVAVCTASGSQVLEVITTDTAGGAIIAWRDSRGLSADVYAQRVSSTGTPLWTTDGVAVCTATGQQNDISIVADGLGGAFLAWRDPRNGVSNNDIYAQALTSSGAPRWAADGVPVASAALDQIEPSISYDGAFGLLVVWQDARNGTDYDIFAQRMKPDGTPRWTANGVQVCDVDSSQSVPLVVSDGARGAILAWTDNRSSNKWPDVYAQRFDSSGVSLWGSNGVAVCSADSAQFLRTMIPDNAGGAILGWDDERGAGQDEDLYAQSVSPSGAIRWNASGVKIGTGSGTRRLTTSAPDGFGGALFAWEDFRNGATSDVFGLRVTSVGTGVEPSAAPRASAGLLTPYPNPFNPHTTIEFTLGEPSRFTLSIHDVHGRLVRTLGTGESPAGTRAFHWDGTRADGSACASGAYFAVLSLPSGTRSTPLRLVR
jgi:hypothetical protein